MNVIDVLFYKLGFLFFFFASLFIFFTLYRDYKENQQKKKIESPKNITIFLTAFVSAFSEIFITFSIIILVIFELSTLFLCIFLYSKILSSLGEYKLLSIISVLIMFVCTIIFLLLDENKTWDMERHQYVVNEYQWYCFFATLNSMIIFAVL